MKTPEQLQREVDIEQSSRKQLLDRLTLTNILSGIEPLSELKGLDKINQKILTRVEDFKDKAIQQIQILAKEANIVAITAIPPVLPNTCPTADTLDKIELIRGRVEEDLVKVTVYLKTVGSSLNIVADLLNGTITTLTALNTLKTVTSVGTKLLPTVPGAVTALLADLDDIRTIITFKTDGTPRLSELKRGVDQGAKYIGIAAQTLDQILGFLDIIDQVLQKCGRDVTPISREFLPVRTPDTLNTYKGFNFRIVEETFSPTVNKKIGQALNAQGIVLLQTESSFTADAQVLIDQLKLIIDRDNLKAN